VALVVQVVVALIQAMLLVEQPAQQVRVIMAVVDIHLVHTTAVVAVVRALLAILVQRALGAKAVMEPLGLMALPMQVEVVVLVSVELPVVQAQVVAGQEWLVQVQQAIMEPLTQVVVVEATSTLVAPVVVVKVLLLFVIQVAKAVKQVEQ
jgi:hypothetical protein